MSIQDEHELRDRLGGLLHGIEPGLAPVAGTMRRGKGIRMRRWISAAAGLGVVAVGAVVLPGLLQHHQTGPTAPLHYNVTVQPPGPGARAGLVAEGTINGRRWQAIVHGPHQNGCEVVSQVLTCGRSQGGQPGPGHVFLESASAGKTDFELGTVGAHVTRVVVELSNGTRLDLRPQRIDGARWVAFAAPALTIQRAMSYAGGTELQYAIPFRNSEFVAWLRPGQVGLQKARFLIGAGDVNGKSWAAHAFVGPWGICMEGIGDLGDCLPSLADFRSADTPVTTDLVCGPTEAAMWFGATARPQVGSVQIRLSDGSSITEHPVEVTGFAKLYVVAVPKALRFVGWTAFDKAGTALGTGAGWTC